MGENKAIPVNVRLIAATHRNLGELTSEGKFRHDLYYRLNVAQIHIPPLRERKEDIPLLAEHFIGELNQRMKRNVTGFGEEMMTLLFRYHWPGNIRELKNIVEASFISLKRGRAEGKAEGRVEGEKIGIEKGERKKAAETARNLLLLGILITEQVAQATGLAVEEISLLQQGLSAICHQCP